MSQTTPPLKGTLAAAGAANRLGLSLTNPDTQCIVMVSGTFTGLQLVLQGAPENNINAATWTGLPAIRMDTLLMETAIVLEPDGLTRAIQVLDNPAGLLPAQAWLIPNLAGLNGVSAYAWALGSGSAAIQLRTGSFFAAPPGSQAQTLGGLMLYQMLMQLLLSVQALKEPGRSLSPNARELDLADQVIRLIT